MIEKISYLKIDKQIFSLNEVNSCTTGNWIGRTFQRLKIKLRTGVSINAEKVDNSLKELSLTSLLNIHNSTKINELYGLLKHTNKLFQSNLKGRVQYTKDTRTFTEKILISNLTCAKSPVLAKYNNQLLWVVKNEKGKWQELSKDNSSQLILENNAAVELIDFESARVEFSSDGKFMINVNQQMMILPEPEQREVLSLNKSIEEMITAMPRADKVQFTFKASDKSSVKTTEPALTEAFIKDSSKFFSETSANDQITTSVMLQAKGYLPEGEYGADWATVDQLRGCTLAIVADAANNKEDSHKGSVDLTRRFRKHLWSNLIQLGSSSLSQEQVQIALTQAIVKTQYETKGDPNCAKCTMACTLVLPAQDGSSHAMGFCIGDSRVMLKKANGSALDLTPTVYSSPYSDTGSAFGSRINQITPIYCKLDAGDTLLLGSDGFGDNMEPKTLGKTPNEALQEVFLSAPDSMSDELRALAKNPQEWLIKASTPNYWTLESMSSMNRSQEIGDWHKSLSEDAKKLLQELHNLYSVLVLTKMEGADIGPTIHRHSTQSDSIKASLFFKKVGNAINMEKSRQSQPLKSKSKKDYEATEIVIITHVVQKQLSDFKNFAVQITGMPGDSEEMQEMFQTWDGNPILAYKWLSSRVGKPDDFSLIALQVKSS
ncbi:MAG: protein phosphatase 2C family protein [Parachlamydiaceae bacterium]|nr:protein phosphatase 2C family protein [Parachlamydiaceae bacterium]